MVEGTQDYITQNLRAISLASPPACELGVPIIESNENSDQFSSRSSYIL
jgi:hypothetical protein